MKFDLEGASIELAGEGEVNRFEECGLSALVLTYDDVQPLIERDICLLETTVVPDDCSLDKHPPAPLWRVSITR